MRSRSPHVRCLQNPHSIVQNIRAIFVLSALPLLTLWAPVGLTTEPVPAALAQNQNLFSAEQESALQEAARLNQQAVQLYHQAQYADALPLAERALEIREQILGDRHSLVAHSFNIISALYFSLGETEQAEILYREVDRKITSILEENGWAYASGEYQVAIDLSHEALQVLEIEFELNSHQFYRVLHDLAVLYHAQGNYSEAEAYYLQIAAIGSAFQLLYTDSSALSASTRILNQLARLYLETGNYSEAEIIYDFLSQIQPLDDRETYSDYGSFLDFVYGPVDAFVAFSNSGIFALEQEHYSDAELLLNQSLEGCERDAESRGAPWLLAKCFSNLGLLQQLQGQYAESAHFYQQSIELIEKTLEWRPFYSPGSAAVQFPEMIEGVCVSSFFSPVRLPSLHEITRPGEYVQYAFLLNNLACLRWEEGKYSEAESLFESAISAIDERPGVIDFHPFKSSILENFAYLYIEQGKYSEAESLLQESLRLREYLLNETHPDNSLGFYSLGVIYWIRGEFEKASTFFEKSFDIDEYNLSLMLNSSSERRKRAYLQTLAKKGDSVISFHLQNAPTNEDAAHLAALSILQRKGRVLDSTTNIFLALQQQLDPENQILLDELRTIDTQRANLVFNVSSEGQAELLKRLEDRSEELQAILARTSVGFSVADQSVDLATLQQQIPDGAALIEIIRYTPFDPTVALPHREDAPRYAAYLFFPSGDRHWVDLGDAAAMDAEVFAFRDALRNPRSEIQPIARSLDARLMQPIRQRTADATHLLLSPDGALNLIPFAALVDEQGQYLGETFTFTYLTSGRDLSRMQRQTLPTQPPVLVANPDYETADVEASLVAMASGENSGRFPSFQGNQIGADQGVDLGIAVSGDRQAIAQRSNTQRSGDFASLSTFAPLPGTQQEADIIQPLLPNATRLEGSRATEDALKQVQRPRILHIATHGFFLQDQDCLATPNARGWGRDAFIEMEFMGDRDCVLTPRNVENPLLRSGLVFAGVNQREQLLAQSEDAEPREDGVLTAQEVTQMNLYGTQLVVLSACETGLGNVVNGDGVYGLRRAFVLAGAESQLMSLWKVDDVGTSQLMGGYYEQLMAGAGRSDALADVQRQLMQTGAYGHPYYWASFIFSGDWRPLDE